MVIIACPVKVLTQNHFLGNTSVPMLQFRTPDMFEMFSTQLNIQFQPVPSRNLSLRPLVVRARANTREEKAKVRNRRAQKKYNGTSTKPRLSVFCSDKQLYAMLVDDQNSKCLFYGSTLQKSIRQSPPCSTIEAAKRVGEELIKACNDLKINEISYYDRNRFVRGERMQAFEIAISSYGFLPR